MLRLPREVPLWDADFFSPDETVLRRGPWWVPLSPRSARLSHQSPVSDRPMILDSRLRVDAVA